MFFFLSGILGELGASPPINVVLHLVSARCNPILFYGLGALHLNKSNYNSLSYPYNSVFTKLFSTFDKNIITVCQFYYGLLLPFSYELDRRTLIFYAKLRYRAPIPPIFSFFGLMRKNAPI